MFKQMRQVDDFCSDWRVKGLLLKAQITLNLYIFFHSGCTLANNEEQDETNGR